MSARSSPWTQAGSADTLAYTSDAVMLVEGQTFCVSAPNGDMLPDYPDGLYFLDTRVLSRWELRVNGYRIERLAVTRTEPFSAVFVGRARPAPGKADADLVVFRRRHVGRGMRERLILRNYGVEPAPVIIELFCDVDFADLFEVKESRLRHVGRPTHEIGATNLRFADQRGRQRKVVTVRLLEPAHIEPGMVTWRHTLPPREDLELCIEVTVSLDGTEIEPRFGCRTHDESSVPSRRLASWQAGLPSIDTDSTAFSDAIARSGTDLGALRIFDPDRPDTPILAAGAPWFMTVFGRDSIITAWMTLIADPSLALGVLETLARFQGANINPETEEEPGKILHEIRFGAADGLALGGGDLYYGSIDATPLFVMLLGELQQWGLADEACDRLLVHADRALAWIEEFGDRDGDGYIEYQRSTPDGLANQGWKDSWDGVRFADGTFPRTPIALCEVQGYVHAAYLARAHLAQTAGDTATFERFQAKAADLRRRFNEDFWLEERGWYALGLDADKRPIDALASNIGHCLWTGIVDPDRAPIVARRLLGPELFSGWGVRTLATTMAAYNPVSYHNGSVWPHDNALCAAGLMRYGFVEEAHRVIGGQLEVAALEGGRLPELFAGFGPDELPVPARYPTACVPQAWGSAAPLLWLRTLLRFDPSAPHGQVWLAPDLPSWMRRLHVRGIEVAGQQVSVHVEGDLVEVDGAGPLEVVERPRPALTTLLDGADR